MAVSYQIDFLYEKPTRLATSQHCKEDGNMEVPDKRLNSISVKGLESKKGERRRLSGDIADTRSPFLEFNPNHESTAEDAAIGYLAQILVEIYLEENADREKEGCYLLPGVHKRAS